MPCSFPKPFYLSRLAIDLVASRPSPSCDLVPPAARVPDVSPPVLMSSSWEPWEQVEDTVIGWDRALSLLTGKIASHHCCGRTPLAGGCYRTNEAIMYRWRCPFWNSHGCRWQARFVIAHCGTMYGPEQDVSKRLVHHRQHDIAVDTQPFDKHVEHMTVPAQGPPPAWYTFVRTHPAAVRWKKHQIVHWLQVQNLADPQHCLCARIQGTFHVVLCRHAHARCGMSGARHGVQTDACVCRTIPQSCPAAQQHKQVGTSDTKRIIHNSSMASPKLPPVVLVVW